MNYQLGYKAYRPGKPPSFYTHVLLVYFPEFRRGYQQVRTEYQAELKQKLATAVNALANWTGMLQEVGVHKDNITRLIAALDQVEAAAEDEINQS